MWQRQRRCVTLSYNQSLCRRLALICNLLLFSMFITRQLERLWLYDSGITRFERNSTIYQDAPPTEFSPIVFVQSHKKSSAFPKDLEQIQSPRENQVVIPYNATLWNDDTWNITNKNITHGKLEIIMPRHDSEMILLRQKSSMSYLSSREQPTVYYAWSDDGIEFRPIVQFLEDTIYHFNTTENNWYTQRYGPIIGFLKKASNESSPEICFSKSVLFRRSPDIIRRLQLLYPHLQNAVALMLVRNQHSFRLIWDIIEKAGSFPILFQIDDPSTCLKDNYVMPQKSRDDGVKKSLPIMTLARRIGCPYYFPIPSFELYNHVEIPPQGKSWDDAFKNWTNTYKSLEEKIPKVFWRGSCTGRSKRQQFVKQSRHMSHLDVRFSLDCNLRTRPTNVKSREESMKYRAVFDIDGNSFSGRFSRLLCYNSVVIKIDTEPEDFEEYFMTDLTPGVHFLPASMENFSNVADYAIQNSNLDAMKEIVRNANAWCKQKLHLEILHYDFLSILNGIITELNRNDSTWIDQWKSTESLYLTPNSTISSEILDW
jgi:Glycosyl transferase family 90